MHRLRVLITKDTGRPAQYPILQQRRIMQVCVFSIKLGATNPTPSTVGESSKPRPPGGAGKFPLVTESRSGSAVPAVSSAGLLQLASSETKGAGREANARCSAQQQSEPWSSPELRCTRNGHTALLQEAPCAVGGPEGPASPTKAIPA